MGTEKVFIPKFVLTGGPCSGKSKGLAMLLRRLGDMGLGVITVPETATDIYSRGVKTSQIKKDPELWQRFQRVILRAQLSSEKISRELARIQPGNGKVIICDRGAMDNLAYIDVQSFREVAKSLGFKYPSMLRDRYNAVFHLVTAAIGAEEHYNHDNPIRHETAKEAVALDRRTLTAWSGHEHLTIISNRDSGKPVSFRRKMEILRAAVCKALGIPIPIEIERKYLIGFGCQPPADAVAFDLVQTYLVRKDPDVERRVRMRIPVDHNSAGDIVYFYTEKKIISDEEREEVDDIITRRDYEKLLLERDIEKATIGKRRFCFPWQDQYFQLDVVEYPIPLILLEIELTDKRQVPLLPDFLNIIKDVTGDQRFRNDGIASGLCPGYK